MSINNLINEIETPYKPVLENVPLMPKSNDKPSSQKTDTTTCTSTS